MSELYTSVLISQENMLYTGEIYTASKNFTLPPAVTGGTSLTSAFFDPKSVPLLTLGTD